MPMQKRDDSPSSPPESNGIPDYPVFSRHNLPDPGHDFAAGAVFLIDKPLKWTSFRVVGLIRKLTGIKKVGHAGTLDPMATGLLIVCTGKATKSIHQFQDGAKRYLAGIRFGGATPSFDAETEILHNAEYQHITLDDIRRTLDSSFLGEIQQTVPVYSAVKHKGRPLYKYARSGTEVEAKVRTVTISGIDIIHYEEPDLKLDIRCEKGTYIRSIANDLGLKLGSLAYLSALRRTEIGSDSVENAIEIETLIRQLDPNGKSGISV